MNPTRSSAVNSARSLRTDALITVTISSSKISDARVMMSTWPLVIGS